MSIYITGDIHGEAIKRFSKKPGHFPERVNLTKDDIMIICGDFGCIWSSNPKDKYYAQEQNELKWLEALPYTTVFIDGNHENHKLIASYPIKEWHGGKVHEISPHVLHLIRGEIYNLEGKTFFAFGGASSHDMEDGILNKDDPNLKQKIKTFKFYGKNRYRIKDVDWWEEELPSEEEFENGLINLEKYNFKVDYVLTHCAPTSIVNKLGDATLKDKYKADCETNYFDELLSAYNLTFSKWYFGHYHENKILDDNFELLYEKIEKIQ